MLRRDIAIFILNYFQAHKMFSSGIVEDLNNKAKVTVKTILRVPHVHNQEAPENIGADNFIKSGAETGPSATGTSATES